ncbi:transposase [Candidatus Thiosymbion oneisti]|uniref:transposase n=1 Tax=Candidatus Thiosymbion oneisti TaxID=589554 RepID=UPI000AAF07DC|nr:transposase [Candidatus Thiosymbion oneisti]
MTAPRSVLVSLEDTPWYHCVCRCVRRAFLCGEDPFSGLNFDHRRGWIVERIQQLAGLFAIDVAAYAVMSNHYHMVVRIDQERALGWSIEEVLRRWTALFTGPLLVTRYLSASRAEMSQAELAEVESLAAVYRARLHDLSWFMRTLNEHIARRANAEDGVKGRFWEGRFKSQALLDEKALLAAMAYVDLNPVRAGLAETPEASDYTSIQERVGGVPKEVTSEAGSQKTVTVKDSDPNTTLATLNGERLRPEAETQVLPPAPLMPFDATAQTPWAVPFAFEDYLELVDWTGRALRADKPGYIEAREPKILVRLGIDGERFVGYSERLLKAFGTAVGAPASLVNLCARRQTKYLRGIQAARALCGSAGASIQVPRLNQA